jgi:hypothetical protein
MIECESLNRHQKDTCLKDIGLRVRNFWTMNSKHNSQHNWPNRENTHFRQWANIYPSIQAPKTTNKVTTNSIFDLLIVSHSFACSIAYEKWVCIEKGVRLRPANPKLSKRFWLSKPSNKASRSQSSWWPDKYKRMEERGIPKVQSQEPVECL